MEARNWKLIDWTRQDVVIALAEGVSRERVRQARKTHGGGVVPSGYRRHTSGTVRDKLEGVSSSSMTLSELAEKGGCGEVHVAGVLRELGKEYKRLPNGNARYDWGKFPVGWEGMTDREIGEVVGVGNPAVVTQWRNRHGYSRVLVGIPC